MTARIGRRGFVRSAAAGVAVVGTGVLASAAAFVLALLGVATVRAPAADASTASAAGAAAPLRASPVTADSRSPARPRQATAPECQAGAYVTSLYDVDPAQSTFSARFWVWSLCPQKAWDPLPGLSFPGATGLTISNDQYSHELGNYRHAELLQGQFHQEIDEGNYPFDKQTLEIEITPAQNISQLRLTADTQDSVIAPGMDVPGWKVTGYHVDVKPKRFVGNLGNRAIPAALGHVKSTLFIDTEVNRADPIGFLQIALPLWLIFLVAAVSFLRIDADPERIGSRVPLLSGLIFAIILNMTSANPIVHTNGVSMIAQLHILTLAIILAALFVSVYHWRWSLQEADDTGQAQLRIERNRRIDLGAGIGVYAVVTALLMLHAAGIA